MKTLFYVILGSRIGAQICTRIFPNHFTVPLLITLSIALTGMAFHLKYSIDSVSIKLSDGYRLNSPNNPEHLSEFLSRRINYNKTLSYRYYSNPDLIMARYCDQSALEILATMIMFYLCDKSTVGSFGKDLLILIMIYYPLLGIALGLTFFVQWL